MGSRTGWSIAIFGVSCISLAVFVGPQVTQVIASIPHEVIAVLVLFAGWHLADPEKIMKTRPSCKLVIAGMTLVALWGGLMTALVTGVVLEWSISKYAQARANG
jgi:MFS superfamily sulfate permease-like transporter